MLSLRLSRYSPKLLKLFFSLSLLLFLSSGCLSSGEKTTFQVTAHINAQHMLDDFSCTMVNLSSRDIKLDSEGEFPAVIFKAFVIESSTDEYHPTYWGYKEYRDAGDYATMLILEEDYEPIPGDEFICYASLVDRNAKTISSKSLSELVK